MAAGTPYFAWIDPTETTFNSGHMRWDENVFSFKLSQDEGDPAALTLVVRRPRDISGNPVGLLNPARKFWCWFALDCGPALVKFRGRLIGVPTNFFQELVTLDFVARPIDIVSQKAALANTLKVLPYYDVVMIDQAKRDDVEAVLEGYTAIWHYDRETLTITISDEIVGEDGTLNFDMSSDANTVLYDGLSGKVTSAPLTKASITAEFSWTQTGTSASVDLTDYILASWPRPAGIHKPVTPLGIQLDESQWPKPGASLGDGWVVSDSTAKNLFDYDTQSETSSSQITTIFPDGDTVRGTSSVTTTTIKNGVAFGVREVTTADNVTLSTQTDPGGGVGGFTATFVSNYTRNTTVVDVRIGIQEIQPTLKVAYNPGGRQIGERVSIDLIADVQPILTDPTQSETLIMDNISSVDLSEPIDGTPPIGDGARDSYVATARGNQSIQYLINLMRAQLMKRARVVEIAFAPKLERMPEVTLRKNVFLQEPRVGQATGKIIGYSIELDGSDGHVKCEIRIGCTIGTGGSIAATAGSPTYVNQSYVGSGYQVFTGQIVPIGTSVGYTPPQAIPGSINLLSGSLTAAEVIDTGLVVQWGDAPAAATISPAAITGPDALATVTEFVKEYWLPQFETQATFKLKTVTDGVLNDYTIATTNLKIPTGYNLAQ